MKFQSIAMNRRNPTGTIAVFATHLSSCRSIVRRKAALVDRSSSLPLSCIYLFFPSLKEICKGKDTRTKEEEVIGNSRRRRDMRVKLLPLFALVPRSSKSSFSSAFVNRPTSLSLSSTSTSVASQQRLYHKTTTTAMSATKQLVVDPFCFRQFAENEASKTYGGTVFALSIKEMEDIVNSRYKEDMLQDGYAPFCKHIFLKNDFTNEDARVNVLKISKDNEHLIRTEYVARNDKELPVLQRYIPMKLINGGESTLPVAKYLDFILYSREQINKENESMGKKSEEEAKETAPWGIVSIKAQDVNYELPMNPITVMRNALGKEHGGSGKDLSRDEYMESVNYWKDHVIIQ